MRNAFASAFSSAILALSSLDAAPARAGSIVTYVSGKGADQGSCTPQSSPCRSFAYALTQTSAGGEIKALDPDGYGPVTISQAVSLVGVEGASINRTSGTHITINAGPSDAVAIANLILDGGGAANGGIVFNSGGSLAITNCVVKNFVSLGGGGGDGIFIGGPTNFLMTDVIVSNNPYGIYVSPNSASATFGALDHVSVVNNGEGAWLNSRGGGQVYVTAVNSVAENNSDFGFYVNLGTTLRLSQSTVAQNNTGVECDGTCQSAGNNFIYGNAGLDIGGTLTDVGTK